MTNIVQRLRAEAKGNLLTSQKGERAMLDAADEIERLRAAVMADWRKLEAELVRWFSRQSGCPRPKCCATGNADDPNGDWIIKIGNGKINISSLAKEIAAMRH